MRRLFIIRKDLNLSAGKLAAMVGHCCEAYWTNLLKKSVVKVYTNKYPCARMLDSKREIQLYRRDDLYNLSRKAFDAGEDYFYAHKDETGKFVEDPGPKYEYILLNDSIDTDIYEGYINGSFVKTICEAKNLTQLLKVVDKAKELGLVEGSDYGFINDKCLTELSPENEDGTCTVGIWFKPLNDDVSHELSKKYQLYKE